MPPFSHGARQPSTNRTVMTESRALYPRSNPMRAACSMSATATRLLGTLRHAGRQARRVPAWRPRRRLSPTIGGCSIRHATTCCCSTSAAAAVRRRMPIARGQHDLASGRRYRAAARTFGRRAMAGLRRLLGLDAVAGLCRDASRARERADPARHLHDDRAELDWYYQFGVSEMFPDKYERLRRADQRRRSAATCSPPITAS